MLTGFMVFGLVLATAFLWWLIADTVMYTKPALQYISFELDLDRLPIKEGSKFTVFGITFTAVNEYTDGVNEVVIAADYQTQWQNIYAALKAAQIDPHTPFSKPFSAYYTVSFGYYITVREVKNRYTPAASTNLFDGALIIHETHYYTK